MNRRKLIKSTASLVGLNMLPHGAWAKHPDGDQPILVVVELSGGNDGLNSVVPYADDAYYQARPTIGIKPQDLLSLDDHYGMNPGMLGLQRLWQDNNLAIVHGCGYERPSYSHFTSMAYWHTGVPHRGNEFGWLGRVADELAHERRDDMLVNIGSQQSLAVKSGHHTPLVFDDPSRFQRSRWMGNELGEQGGDDTPGSPNHTYLTNVDRSAQVSAARIRQAWDGYKTDIDYGVAPMDLPKVAACIDAGMDTQLYHVSFRNNSFDTHVQQPALHRRLLSYACDGIHGFIKDLEKRGHAQRVAVLVFSEFGRRVPENANLGTDHGSANVMFVAGHPVAGGHFGKAPSLTELVDGDNLAYTTDFRQVYATLIEDWLGVQSANVLGQPFDRLGLFS
jgi:uncharacterized protein (DUF1501 family)